MCSSLLYDQPLENLLLVVRQDWQALVSPAKREGREGLDWKPRILLEKPFLSRLIIARSHPGSP